VSDNYYIFRILTFLLIIKLNMSLIKKSLVLLAAMAAAAIGVSGEPIPAGVGAAADTYLVKNIKNYLMPVIL
jgi:hypothetical protein